MQLKFERDFFIRPTRGSDKGEVVGLIQKLHSTEIGAQIEGSFANLLATKDIFFKVLLNSNGVLIGGILCEKTKIVTLAINPNFLRKEVRDEVTRQLKVWADTENGGTLLVPKEIAAGDWKAYWKHNAVKVEGGGVGVETLEF